MANFDTKLPLTKNGTNTYATRWRRCYHQRESPLMNLAGKNYSNANSEGAALVEIS